MQSWFQNPWKVSPFSLGKRPTSFRDDLCRVPLVCVDNYFRVNRVDLSIFRVNRIDLSTLGCDIFNFLHHSSRWSKQEHFIPDLVDHKWKACKLGLICRFGRVHTETGVSWVIHSRSTWTLYTIANVIIPHTLPLEPSKWASILYQWECLDHSRLSTTISAYFCWIGSERSTVWSINISAYSSGSITNTFYG